MTPKQRFLSAVKGGQPDKVPMFDDLCSVNLFEYLLGYRPKCINSKDIMLATEKLGLDAAHIMFGEVKPLNPVDKSGNIYTNEWGTKYKSTSYSWPSDAPVDFPIKSISDLKNYKIPDPNEPGRLDDVKLAVKMNKGEVAIVGVVLGPLTNAFLLAGWYPLSYSLMEDCKLATKLFEISNGYFNQAALNMIEAGVDVIIIAEDLGFKSSTFFSRDTYRKNLFPYIEEQIKIIKGKNIPVFFHCDGNINSIVQDLVEMGIDCLHPIQKTANMDLLQIKQEYGDKIAICGNVDSTYTLTSGSIEKVIEETKECIKIGAPGGGYILSSDSDLRDDMPVENILAMFEAGRKYGKYPIKNNIQERNQLCQV